MLPEQCFGRCVGVMREMKWWISKKERTAWRKSQRHEAWHDWVTVSAKWLGGGKRDGGGSGWSPEAFKGTIPCVGWAQTFDFGSTLDWYFPGRLNCTNKTNLMKRYKNQNTNFLINKKYKCQLEQNVCVNMTSTFSPYRWIHMWSQFINRINWLKWDWGEGVVIWMLNDISSVRGPSSKQMAHSNWVTWGTEQNHCYDLQPRRNEGGEWQSHSEETVALRQIPEHEVELGESIIQPHSPLSLWSLDYILYYLTPRCSQRAREPMDPVHSGQPPKATAG